MSELTMPADWDQGPRRLFGKTYFWALEDGRLVLLPSRPRPERVTVDEIKARG